jgi:hypothetical protein
MSPGPWLFLQVSTMHQFNHLFICVQWYISKFSSKCLNFLLVCNKHHCVVFHSCLYRCMCRVIHITVYLKQEINEEVEFCTYVSYCFLLEFLVRVMRAFAVVIIFHTHSCFVFQDTRNTISWLLSNKLKEAIITFSFTT